jgi:choline dehydrogenase-like flavoprotein
MSPVRVFESDVCVIGGGISAALLAESLSEKKPGWSVTVVEAGRRLFDLENRMAYRRRSMLYGENQWPGDFIEDQAPEGMVSRTMAVGGSAMHWQGHANRFSAEDLRLRSMYGLAVDWALSWEELEPFMGEAERRIGVAGDPSPHPEDARTEPYPMPAIPLTYNLEQIKQWAERADIPFYGCPLARNSRPYDGRAQCSRCNTCTVCPTGARYSPDFTFKKLLGRTGFALHDRTLIRKLVLHDTLNDVAAAVGVHEERPDEPLEYRARVFVLASGYVWSPHLLLLSADARFPRGLANRSDTVGRYMTGHKFMTANIEVPTKLYPGMNAPYPLISRQHFRCPTDKPYARFDIQIFESESGRGPRLKGERGEVQFGDDLMDDWRARNGTGAARVRMYYDVHPSPDSRLTLNSDARNRYGDPMPRIVHEIDDASEARDAATQAQIQKIYDRIARANGTRILGNPNVANYLDHPCGGCRMGDDPATSVCDGFGRTHDHENLFVVGAPTLPTGGCTNGTITFAGLTLRSAVHIAATM